MLVHFHPFYKRLPEVYIEVENFKVCVCVDVCVCVCVCGFSICQCLCVICSALWEV